MPNLHTLKVMAITGCLTAALVLSGAAFYVSIVTGLRTNKAEDTLTKAYADIKKLQEFEDKAKTAFYLMAQRLDELEPESFDKPTFPKLDFETNPENMPSPVTERQVAKFREDKTLPKKLTRQFIRQLTKREISDLAGSLRLKMENYALTDTQNRQLRRFYRARLSLVESERQKRGHIK